MSKANVPIQSIEELQSRFQKFSDQKIKVETQREHVQQELEKLKTQAREEFGSDDLETLKRKLAEMKRSNEQQRVDYQKQLDQIEQKLAEIQQQFVAADLDEA